MVYEHAKVVGGSGESLAAARHKSFGRRLGIQPLEPDTPVHPCRVLFIYKPNNAYSRRVEQQRALKRVLGRQYLLLVNKAVRSTKEDLMKLDLIPDGEKAIARRLKAGPSQFWQLANGKEFLNLQASIRQLVTFEYDCQFHSFDEG